MNTEGLAQFDQTLPSWKGAWLAAAATRAGTVDNGRQARSAPQGVIRVHDGRGLAARLDGLVKQFVPAQLQRAALSEWVASIPEQEGLFYGRPRKRRRRRRLGKRLPRRAWRGVVRAAGLPWKLTGGGSDE